MKNHNCCCYYYIAIVKNFCYHVAYLKTYRRNKLDYWGLAIKQKIDANNLDVVPSFFEKALMSQKHLEVRNGIFFMLRFSPSMNNVYLITYKVPLYTLHCVLLKIFWLLLFKRITTDVDAIICYCKNNCYHITSLKHIEETS